MSTLSLDIWTGAYPSIADDIEIRVYTQADPLAVVTSLRHGPPHLADSWSFPGLERTNYLFRIFEMSGGTTIRQLGDDMNVVPGSTNGVAYRATEQIQADTTIGFVSGINIVIFDGTDGKEDWRGWDIATLDRIGLDSMRKDVDYTYDKATGTITLLQEGDVFGPLEWFNVDFATQITEVTESVPDSFPQFSTPQIITADYSVNSGTDFGGLLIIKPSGNYLEIAFPDIATVVAGKLITIEMAAAGVNKCAKLIFQAGQTLDWLLGARPDLYICPNESISIYKFIDTTGDDPVSMWRVYGDPGGNFKKVGEQVADDNIAGNVFNKVLFDGGILDNKQFARLYNDFILSLPGGQVVNYDDWTTGNNKYKYSLANSSNPANTGKFHVPDRRDLFERITDGTRLPGDWQDQMLLLHDHVTHGKGAFLQGVINWFLSITNNRYSQGGGSDKIGGKNGSPDTNMRTGDTGGAENRPANIAIRKYLLV
jgi:hypothetical protein